MGKINNSDPTPEIVLARAYTWRMAVELVDPIVEKHSLETYRTGPMFGVTSVVPPVEQYIDHIMRVADWLLDKD